MLAVPTFEFVKNIAVLISDKGTGTNLQSIIDATKGGEIDGKVVVVVSNTSKAFGLQRAQKHSIPTEVFGWKKYQESGRSREEYSKDLTKLLQKYKLDLVVLAGWILILKKEFFEQFPYVLNIHPGLIPDTPGKKVYFPDGKEAPTNEQMHTENAIGAFLNGGYKYAGSTVHFATPTADWGPVVFRDFEEIKKDDTVDSLYTRLKKKEHKMLVTAVKLFCEGKLTGEKIGKIIQ